MSLSVPQPQPGAVRHLAESFACASSEGGRR